MTASQRENKLDALRFQRIRYHASAEYASSSSSLKGASRDRDGHLAYLPPFWRGGLDHHRGSRGLLEGDLHPCRPVVILCHVHGARYRADRVEHRLHLLLLSSQLLSTSGGADEDHAIRRLLLTAILQLQCGVAHALHCNVTHVRRDLLHEIAAGESHGCGTKRDRGRACNDCSFRVHTAFTSFFACFAFFPPLFYFSFDLACSSLPASICSMLAVRD
mmetsp:Transcript_367/g.550  ORF Transcript_367/g.550 Transcript_367/m.550 type:complete len:218 (-) Transcript_367:12-665(-)